MEGKCLGPYRLLAPLGSGGMGEVYRAEAVESVPGIAPGAAVALKVIHAHLLDSEDHAERFLREALVGQRVRHANVVRTYDSGVAELAGRRRRFLVMEYVAGQTLRELMNELERVPEELCRHIGREVAQGLAAIHESGAIHRDIKPENVLITPEQTVKVMDLGVARLMDEAIRLSQTGQFVGSILYAAPEAFRTGGKSVDGRADLHSLGVMLYELSTGLHPYQHDEIQVVLRRVLQEEPRRAGEVNPQLSPFFEEVAHSLLAKDPDGRIESAAALARILAEGEETAWWHERARSMRIQTKRPLRRIRIPRETALYGRDDDLVRLRALYEQAKKSQGQVLLVQGEAGIGKTRLVDELVGLLQREGEELNFLFGSYPPGGAATAAGAFSTAYREQFGAEALDDTLGQYLEETPALVPAFAALLRGEGTPAGAEALTKDALQTCFVHATRGLAAERTTVVLIDDLHFAPEEGRALFAALALAVPGSRTLLVGTTRPGLDETWLSSLDRVGATRQALTRLGAKDVATLLHDVLKSERTAEALAYQVILKSDGNPFFVFEILRGLREGQFLTQAADGSWHTTQVIQDIQIPSSLVDLIQARLGDLSEEEHELLDVAACCGFEFDPSLIADVVQTRVIPTLRAFGRIEQAHRLVRSSGRDFAFDHHQVQEVIYAGQPPRLREQYHAAIAEALERREGAAEKEPAELDGALCVSLAEHFFQGADGGRAVRYLDTALDHLEQGYLHDRAIALADRALDTAGLLAEERRIGLLIRKNWRLSMLGRRAEQDTALSEALALAESGGHRALLQRVEFARAMLLKNLSRAEDARPHYERALRLAEELEDRRGQADAIGGLGGVALARHDLPEARDCYERSLALHQELGNRDGEARMIGNLGIALRVLSRYEESRQAAEESLAIYRETGNQAEMSRSLLNLSAVLNNLGRPEEAYRSMQRALELQHAMGDRPAAATTLSHMGPILHALGRLDEAKEHLERGLAMHREVGDADAVARAFLNLGAMFSDLGRFEEAREHGEKALAMFREIGNRHAEAIVLSNLGNICGMQGRQEEERSFYEQALPIHRELGDRTHEANTLAHLGVALSDLGFIDEARRNSEAALQIAQETGDPVAQVRFGGLVAIYLLALGQNRAAREQMERSLALLDGLDEQRVRADALRSMAAIAAQEGNTEEARRWFDDAIRQARELNSTWDLTHAYAKLGELSIQDGRLEQAAEELEQAAALANELGVPTAEVTAVSLQALLPGGDVAAAEALLESKYDEIDAEERLRAHFCLWRATGERQHLSQARRLLDEFLEKVPEAYHQAMLTNIPLMREVTESWAVHGGDV